MDLTHQQREKIRLLLEQGVRDACRSALDRGARPADLADHLAGRRHALHLLVQLADDPHQPVDDEGTGRRLDGQG